MEKGKQMNKCRDCIHCDVCELNPFITAFSPDNDAYCGAFKSREEYVKVVPGMTVQKWIPVTERLPKGADGKSICETVIAYLDHKKASPQVCVGWVNGKRWYLIVGNDDFYTSWKFEDVTHWMPLPDAPKGE